MKRNNALYLKDIIDNMEHAENFLVHVTFEEFSRDVKTSYAKIKPLITKVLQDMQSEEK